MPLTPESKKHIRLAIMDIENAKASLTEALQASGAYQQTMQELLEAREDVAIILSAAIALHGVGEELKGYED